MPDDLPGSVFVRDGARFVPTPLAHGPWHDRSQHGSAMMGLLARELEAAPALVPMQVTRMTVDLLRAAPMAPVTTEHRVTRTGKSVETVESWLSADNEVFARAHAVRYRVSDIPVGEAFAVSPEVPELDPRARIPLPRGKTVALHEALHLSPVRGFSVPAMWVRMLSSLVEGEPLTPLIRTAVAIDWVYAAVSLRTWTLTPQHAATRPFVTINTDNHFTLARPIEGEWVCLDAGAVYGPVGAGSAGARIFDQRGMVGFATQTLLQRGLDKGPKAWG